MAPVFFKYECVADSTSGRMVVSLPQKGKVVEWSLAAARRPGIGWYVIGRGPGGIESPGALTYDISQAPPGPGAYDHYLTSMMAIQSGIPWLSMNTGLTERLLTELAAVGGLEACHAR